MPVLTFPFGHLEANASLLHNGQDAVVVDPPDDTSLVLNLVRDKKLTLRAILITHLHFDHVSGVAAMAEATGLPVYVGEEDWKLRKVMLSGGMLFGLPPVREFEATPLQPGPVSFGSLQCEVIHAPGHSPGSLAYYFAEEKALIAGDVLFYRSVGRSDFPGGDEQALRETLTKKIYVLPPDTVVYTGHYQSTTVGDEARNNPFCRA